MKRLGIILAAVLLAQTAFFSTHAFAQDVVPYYVEMLNQHHGTWAAANSPEQAKSLHAEISRKMNGRVAPYDERDLRPRSDGKVNFFLRILQ